MITTRFVLDSQADMARPETLKTAQFRGVLGKDGGEVDAVVVGILVLLRGIRIIDIVVICVCVRNVRWSRYSETVRLSLVGIRAGVGLRKREGR